MKLSYKKYPVLRFIDERNLRKDVDLMELRLSNPPSDSKKRLELISKGLIEYVGILTNCPVFLLSNSFVNAINKNLEKLKQLLCSEDYRSNLERNIILILPDGNIYFSRQVKDEGKVNTFVGRLDYEGNCKSLSEVDYPKEIRTSLVDLKSDDAFISFCRLLIILLFKKYASVDLEIVKAGTKKKSAIADKGKVINELGVDVTLLDSRWFREIIRNEGFKVSGHFRLQPCKDENGEWKRKLIYIKDFEKHGYHRRAQISIENEDIDN